MAAKLHVRKTKERIGNCFTNPTPQNFKLLPSFLGASSVKHKHPAQMRKSPLDLMLHLLVFITARQSTELASQQWKKLESVKQTSFKEGNLYKPPCTCRASHTALCCLFAVERGLAAVLDLVGCETSLPATDLGPNLCNAGVAFNCIRRPTAARKALQAVLKKMPCSSAAG